MATIPNLNTLRTGRRGPRSRAGRAQISTSDDRGRPAQDAEAGRDQVVQQTDNDATISRLSAVALGYLEDSYASLLISPEQSIPKRYPIINRGTYVRTKAIDRLVKRFLDVEPSQRKQIVSLGAGSDTRFFRLATDYASADTQILYHELDFETNVNAKRSSIRQSTELSALIADSEHKGRAYRLHALDLRSLIASSPPTIPDLDPELPTLLLSECCLCYLSPEQTGSILAYFTFHVSGTLALILYEPVRPFDAFGRTMVSNLSSRGIHLQTLQRYASLEAQRRRLREAGLTDGQGARDVRQIYDSNGTDVWVSRAERERIEGLEWLDEVEEWNLLASHYCVAWGWRGEVFTKAWHDIEGGRTRSEDGNDIG